jgi:dipeptidase E
VAVRVLLISNSGRPLLGWCRSLVADFLGSAKAVAVITAASLGDERLYFERVREPLAAAGLDAIHCAWPSSPLAALERAGAIFVGGGNTYALLKRLREAKLLEPIRERTRAGTPYVGSSAGSNVAGPNILTTNDWNVVGLDGFEALRLVPFNINPHYRETDPTMAAHSETRDERIAEYHIVNANPVVGIEESTAVRVEAGVATVAGSGRVKLFRRGQPPCWLGPGERLPV